MILSGALCIFSYCVISLSPLPALSLLGCGICGFSVGIMWPGAFSIGASALKGGGTALFALMALAGDLGCSGGPSFVGLISAHAGDNLKLGIQAAVIFPALLMAGVLLIRKIHAEAGSSQIVRSEISQKIEPET